MGRKLRYIPDGGAVVEVTCRTLHGRLLLRPSLELNDIAAGILGRAQRLYPVELILYSLSSNTYVQLHIRRAYPSYPSAWHLLPPPPGTE
jgi:hypothetical protein